jgi:hypothetical protein
VACRHETEGKQQRGNKALRRVGGGGGTGGDRWGIQGESTRKPWGSSRHQTAGIWQNPEVVPGCPRSDRVRSCPPVPAGGRPNWRK